MSVNNTVILVGRLTAEPETKELTYNKCTSYRLAVERFKRPSEDSAQADFINIRTFGKSAEFAQNWFHKGLKVIVRGRIETDSYTNKDGVKVNTFNVIAEDQGFAESKAAAEQSAVQTGKKPEQTEMFIPDNLEDEGLPFK